MNTLPERSATDALIEAAPFQSGPEADRLFLESFRETASLHLAGSPPIRAFWERAGLRPDDLRSVADLARVPAPSVNLFKEWDFRSVPESEIALLLTSSGTGGRKSQMLLNEGSLARVKRLAYRVHEALGMTSEDVVNYLCFTYDPRVAKDLGTAFTDELLTCFTGRNRVVYAFQWDEAIGAFRIDEDRLLQTLLEFEKEGKPVRILGFPAYLHRLLKHTDRNFRFGDRSWVQTGGGWKGLSDEEIPKEKFRELVSSRLGLPKENVRDLFGMVEHGIPYVDCALGNLHVPNYARLIVRDPHTLAPLAEGEKGLLQFLCTYNDSYPTMSFLSTDWGRVSRCRCPLPGVTLEILGRAGVKKHKGCALHALGNVR